VACTHSTVVLSVADGDGVVLAAGAGRQVLGGSDLELVAAVGALVGAGGDIAAGWDGFGQEVSVEGATRDRSRIANGLLHSPNRLAKLKVTCRPHGHPRLATRSNHVQVLNDQRHEQ